MVYLQVRRTFPLDVTTFMFGLVDNTKLSVKMVHSIGSLRLFNTIAARVSAAKTAVVVTKDSSMEGKSTDIIFIESSFLSRDSPDGRLSRADNLPFRRSRQAAKGSSQPRTLHRPASRGLRPILRQRSVILGRSWTHVTRRLVIYRCPRLVMPEAAASRIRPKGHQIGTSSGKCGLSDVTVG